MAQGDQRTGTAGRTVLGIGSFRASSLHFQQPPAGSNQVAVVGPRRFLADAQAAGSRSFPLAEGYRVDELTVEQLHWLLASIDLAAAFGTKLYKSAEAMS